MIAEKLATHTDIIGAEIRILCAIVVAFFFILMAIARR